MSDVVMGSGSEPLKDDAREVFLEVQPQFLGVSLEPVLRRCLTHLDSQGSVAASRDAQSTCLQVNPEQILA